MNLLLNRFNGRRVRSRQIWRYLSIRDKSKVLQESDQKRLRIPLVSHMMLFFEVLCARTWICSLKEQSHFLPWKLVFCLWFLAMWLLRYAEKGASWSMNGAFKSFFRMKIRCGGVKRFLKQNISSFLSLTRLTQSPDLPNIRKTEFF